MFRSNTPTVAPIEALAACGVNTAGAGGLPQSIPKRLAPNMTFCDVELGGEYGAPAVRPLVLHPSTAPRRQCCTL